METNIHVTATQQYSIGEHLAFIQRSLPTVVEAFTRKPLGSAPLGHQPRHKLNIDNFITTHTSAIEDQGKLLHEIKADLSTCILQIQPNDDKLQSLQTLLRAKSDQVQ